MRQREPPRAESGFAEHWMKTTSERPGTGPEAPVTGE